MKKSEVEIGLIYWVRIGSRMAKIQIDSESPYGGWIGHNLRTNRRVRIRSAQRLRGLVAGGFSAVPGSSYPACTNAGWHSVYPQADYKLTEELGHCGQ